MSDSDDDVFIFRRRQPACAAAPPVPALASPPRTPLTSPAEEEVVTRAFASLSLSAAAPPSALGVAPSLPPSSLLPADGWVEDAKWARLPGAFKLPRKLFDQLYPYQREGVAWMWSLHGESPVAAGSLGRGGEGCAAARPAAGGAKAAGGILADDMGLGKTMQTISFVAGCLHGEVAATALIVLPVSLLPTWQAEFARFAPAVVVHTLHEQGALPARAKLVKRVQDEGGVLLTTYGMVTSTPALFGSEAEGGEEGEEEGGGGGGRGRAAAGRAAALKKVAAILGGAPPVWDLLLLDEGHRVKNPSTATARALRATPARYRLLLTGTPIQNNLDELWALFDFTHCGALLDTRAAFNRTLGNRVTAARDKGASPETRAEGALAMAELIARIGPYLLRREKEKLLAQRAEDGAAGGAPAAAATEGGGAAPPPPPPALGSLQSIAPSAKPATGAASTAMGVMGFKKEVVLWAPLVPAQRALYMGLSSALRRGENEAMEVNGHRGKGNSFVLTAISNLRKLATHPILLVPSKRRVALAAAQAMGVDAEDAAAARLLDVTVGEVGGTGGEGEGEDEGGGEGEEWVPQTPARGGGGGWALPPPPTPPHWGPGPASSQPPPPPVELWSAAALPPAETLVGASGKLRVLVLLLRQAVADGAKVLVFSQYTRTLDVIEVVLRALFALDGEACGVRGLEGGGGSGGGGVRFNRVDGTLRPGERAAAVAAFNADPAISVCLLSTGVGAHGLTLTAATRVVVFDPSWNPAVDAQAVDRAYRVGQSRDVVTYRLITAGTVEEKMYRLQVFKAGLTSTVMGAQQQRQDGYGGGGGDAPRTPAAGGACWESAAAGAGGARRFMTKADLKDLLVMGESSYSETQRMVDAIVAPPPIASREVALHLAALAAPPHAAVSVGLSHHDHLFSLAPEEAAALRAIIKENAAAEKAGATTREATPATPFLGQLRVGRAAARGRPAAGARAPGARAGDAARKKGYTREKEEEEDATDDEEAESNSEEEASEEEEEKKRGAAAQSSEEEEEQKEAPRVFAAVRLKRPPRVSIALHPSAAGTDVGSVLVIDSLDARGGKGGVVVLNDEDAPTAGPRFTPPAAAAAATALSPPSPLMLQSPLQLMGQKRPSQMGARRSVARKSMGIRSAEEEAEYKEFLELQQYLAEIDPEIASARMEEASAIAGLDAKEAVAIIREKNLLAGGL
jgi:SNF2 family DNA or RNA helicase